MSFVPFVVPQEPMSTPNPNAAKKQEKKMPNANNSDTELYWIIGIVAAFFLVLLLIGLVSFLNDFSQELKRLNSEIGRSRGSERRYWLRKRRKLWLSLIPFVKY